MVRTDVPASQTLLTSIIDPPSTDCDLVRLCNKASTASTAFGTTTSKAGKAGTDTATTYLLRPNTTAVAMAAGKAEISVNNTGHT